MDTFRKVILTSALGLSLFAGGCSSLFGDGDDDDNDRVGSSRSSRDDYDRDARVSRGDVDRDSGTARKVPRDARVVDEGRGSTLSYSARYDGEVYLLDSTAGVVVWDAKVRDGDRITVDPSRNRIELNSREQANIDLKSQDRFQLYFLESSGRSSRSTRY